jgi:hypothetical protein
MHKLMTSLDKGHQHSYTAGASKTGQGGQDLHEHFLDEEKQLATESGHGHTHELLGEDKMLNKKIELFQPLIKIDKGGKVTYEAVLSDDSTDRDDEIVGSKALKKIEQDNNFIVGLIDHENKVFNQVCEWTNKRCERRKGHTAFIAEPKFFLSNPKAQVLKGMLDEGASFGVSIGAIVKDYEMKEVDGSEKRVFTNLEVVEASFVAVPANSHARIMAVAKMFGNKEAKKMSDKTYSEKEFKEVADKVKGLEKDISESKENLDKAIKEKEALDKQVADLKEKSEKIDALEKEIKEHKEKAEKLPAIEKELEEIKAAPWFKGHMEPDSEEAQKQAELTKESLEKGLIPVLKVA